MEGTKTGDGFGVSYIKDGNFITRKYIRPLPDLLKSGIPVLSHLPDHQGFTLVHSRKASCGQIDKNNIHPFLSPFDKPKYAICHNGYFSHYRTVELCLGKQLTYPANTDSAAGAHLISIIGMRRFYDEYDNCGVWLCLNLKGELEVIKTKDENDLVFYQYPDNKVLIASELKDDKYKKYLHAFSAYYKFNPDGTLKFQIQKQYESKWIGNQYSKFRTKNKIGGPLGSEWKYQQNSQIYRGGMCEYWD